MRGRPDGTPGKTLSQTNTMSTQPDLLTTPETPAPELVRARTAYDEALETLERIESEGDDTGLAIAFATVTMRNAKDRLEKLELEAMK
jgi:hypothetical protein